jgi:hypothetical protein
MKLSRIALPALSGLLLLGSLGGVPAPAKADSTSTALIAVGAAAIVGALLYDGNNHPYYVRDNRRYYVTQDEAQYYRGHHQMQQRQAWVPEREYPVERNPYQHDDRYQHDRNDQH